MRRYNPYQCLHKLEEGDLVFDKARSLKEEVKWKLCAYNGPRVLKLDTRKTALAKNCNFFYVNSQMFVILWSFKIVLM